MNTTGKVVVGTMVGLAAGAILGVLYAPDKGSKTRKKIADKGHDFADGVKSKYREFADSIAEKIHGSKDGIHELAETAKGSMK